VESVSKHHETKKDHSAVRNYQQSEASLHPFSVWQLLNASKHGVQYKLDEPRQQVETGLGSGNY